jgi:hypothetical protein
MKAKKVLLLVAAAALVYTLIAHPAQLGAGVQAVRDWLVGGVEAVITFLRSIVS